MSGGRGPVTRRTGALYLRVPSLLYSAGKGFSQLHFKARNILAGLKIDVAIAEVNPVEADGFRRPFLTSD